MSSHRRRFILILAFGILTATFSPQRSVAAPLPAFKIDAPKHVAVGSTITVKLSVTNAVDLAGYETSLRFDTSVAEFAGVRQRQNDLKRLGRDISPLTALTRQGVAIGLYSCPVANCVAQQGPRIIRGGRGTVRLADVMIQATAPGLLEIRFAATTFVDATGQSIDVANSTPTLVIQVGAAGSGPRHAAPAERTQNRPTRTASVGGPADLTGDRAITHADVSEVALSWELTRLADRACGPLDEPRHDINRDGCITVADLQSAASQYSAAPPGGSRPTGSLDSPQSGLTFTVNGIGDQGDAAIGNQVCATAAGMCTLRAAIQEANAHAGPDEIVFAIPRTGVQTIQLNGRLPTLNDQTGPTTIDGYTQSGAQPNTDARLSNAVLQIQIAGTGEDNFVGFSITSPGNVIRGLALYRLNRPFWLYNSGARDNIIAGNFIGTNATATYGAAALALVAHGVHIEQGAGFNRVGGTALADRNVISGNGRHGVGLWHEQTDSNTVINNLIGLSPDGTRAIPNRKHGLDLNFGTASNVYQSNVISGNDDNGVEVSHTTNTTNNQVVGNFIGTDVTGTRAPAYTANQGRGIMIEDGATANTIANNVIGNNGFGGIEVYDDYTTNNTISGNRIGISLDGTAIPNGGYGIWLKGKGFQIGPQNLIAYNTYTGIKIEGENADFNTINRNSIFRNGTLGIDLAPIASVNQNDAGDLDTGANDQLNFPALATASKTLVSGTACGGCIVEVFRADGGSQAYGEGEQFVGSATADSSGQFQVAVSGLIRNNFVTATATDALGNTSEFSRNIIVK